MNKFFFSKRAIVFGMTLLFVSGINLEMFGPDTAAVFAQERDKSTESKKTQTYDKLGKAKQWYNNALDWVGHKIIDFTDYIDELVDFGSENKGPMALFGVPIYIASIVIFFFVIKLGYNIFRDILRAIFGKSEAGPRRRTSSRPRRR